MYRLSPREYYNVGVPSLSLDPDAIYRFKRSVYEHGIKTRPEYSLKPATIDALHSLLRVAGMHTDDSCLDTTRTGGTALLSSF